jgi:hypothetical protein
MGRIPWEDEIDDHLFYHYVLPHRVSQEPLERFTAVYADTLHDLVSDLEEMREAVFRVNEWVFTRVKYEPTSRWDQGSLVTLRRGYGRCEELASLSIKAMKTVGIPSRKVYTPWWPFTNSNHAWVEVWVDGEWHFIGGAEPSDLDRGWFAVSAERTAMVKGVVYGDVAEDVEIVYKKEEGATVVNTTPNYASTVELTVRATVDEAPAESASVSVCVYNYSSLPPVGLKTTDEEGSVTFVVGRSDLFVYASADSLRGWSLWRPPEGERDTVLIEMTDGELSDTSFWLYTRRAEKKGSSSERKANVDSLKLLQELHLSRLNVVDSSLVSLLGGRDRELMEIFYHAKGGAKALGGFYRRLPDRLKVPFVDFFDALPTKDVVSLDTIGLADELESILTSVELADDLVPDSIVDGYVISNRILFEQPAFWRGLAQKEFIGSRRQDVSPTVDEVFAWTGKHVEESDERGYFGPMKTPKDVLVAGRATELEKYIFVAGVLRSLGIPARVKWDYEALEFWDGEWRERSFEEEEDAEPSRAWLDVRFEDRGEDVTRKQRYYYDFSMTKFGEYPTRLDPPVDTTEGRKLVTLDDEPLCCITGWRNGFGDTYVRLKRVRPTADTNRVAAEVGVPEAARAGDLVVRAYSGLAVSELEIEEEELNEGEILIVVFDTESEASRSTLKNAAGVIEAFPGRVYLFGAVSERDLAERFLDEMGIDGGELHLVSESVYRKKWKIRSLPSILCLRDGECLLWVEGLLLHLPALVESLY